MNLTSRDLHMWEHGFLAGREDECGILIAAMIEKGRKTISLNELRDINYRQHNSLPLGYMGEQVHGLLEELKQERMSHAVQPDNRHQ